MTITHAPIERRRLAKNALITTGINAAIVIALIVISLGSDTSNDIARAFAPAAIVFAIVAMLAVYWPLSMLAMAAGLRLARDHATARRWLAWAIAGTGIGAAVVTSFFAIISGGYFEMQTLWLGLTFGLISGVVGHRLVTPATSMRDMDMINRSNDPGNPD